jgi:acyl carrier protein
MQKADEQEIFKKISEIITTAMRTDPAKITSEARLFTDLGAESLDILDIRFRMEGEFGFKISDGEIIRRLGENITVKEIEEIFTVQSLIDYVKERLADQS